MISTLFGWFWLIANLAVAWLALTRRPNYLIRSFIVGGAILGMAAGLCNGLVMTVNGWRMPVESGVVDWERTPHFLNGPEHEGRFYCRAYRMWDPPPDPWNPNGLHVEVPPTRSDAPSSTDAPSLPKPFTPKLAFLDDRHPYAVCGEQTLFSKGDMMGLLGGLLMAVGLTLLFLTIVWRKIRCKRKPAS